MLVNSVSSLNINPSKMMAHKAVEQPQPEQKPVEDQGVTASLYFTGHDKKGNKMRNATMAGLGSLVLLSGTPVILSSCDKDDAWAEAKSYSDSNASATANDTATFYISTHGRGCNCDKCCNGRDTIYKYDTLYVDTGSYHVSHDTIVKWKDRFIKPIPLDTLAKITNIIDVPTQDPSRKNIINYQGTREWDYGNKFVANINLLESSKNILVYDREDLDWQGNHKGWGKDVYRIPTSSFKIKTYDGKVLNSPKGMFLDAYANRYDEKSSIYDNDRVQSYFLQTIGDHVRVFSYDKETGLYREDGEFSAGYLNIGDKGRNILLTDLIASDPSIKWSDDPQYSTEDHVVGVKTVAVNDEELKTMYVRELDDAYAEEHYGVAR